VAIMRREVQLFQPDVILLESAFGIDVHAMRRLRDELKVPLVMYYGDAAFHPNHHHERILQFAQICSHVVVVDVVAERIARDRGVSNVEFIPNVGYDHYHHHHPALPQDIDVLFTGQSYRRWQSTFSFMGADRIRYVKTAQQVLGARLHVVGEDWSEEGVNSTSGGLATWEVDTLNRRSKIVLAIDALQLQGFTSIRTFNALLSGAFLLIAYFPGIENLFRNGTHLVWFRNEAELSSLLRHYLHCDHERAMIAREGSRYVHRNGWLYSAMLRYLLERGSGIETRSFGEVQAPPQPFRSLPSQHCPHGTRDPIMGYDFSSTPRSIIMT